MRELGRLLLGIATVAASGMLALTAARAAELSVLSPPSLRPVLVEVLPRYETATASKVTVSFELMPPMARRIEAGAQFDVAILTEQLMQAAAGVQGRIDAGSVRPIGRTGAGMAVRKGAARPDISTVERFAAALKAARSIGYTADGAAGNAFLAMLERIGVAADVKSRLRPLPGGGAVEPVARGEVELSVTTIPGIMEVPGADLVGPLPDALQSWVAYAAGVSRGSQRQAEGARFIAFLQSAETGAVMKAKGVEPASR